MKKFGAAVLEWMDKQGWIVLCGLYSALVISTYREVTTTTKKTRNVIGDAGKVIGKAQAVMDVMKGEEMKKFAEGVREIRTWVEANEEIVDQFMSGIAMADDAVVKQIMNGLETGDYAQVMNGVAKARAASIRQRSDD